MHKPPELTESPFKGKTGVARIVQAFFNSVAGFTATAQINRGDFGIDRWTGGAVVGDKVQVSLKIETVLQR